MGWITPTGHETPTDWVSPEKAYDDDTAFAATYSLSPETWSPYLVLTHAALTSNKLRYYADYREDRINTIDVDVYKDSAWADVYQGSYADREWEEKTFTEGSVTKSRTRFYNSSPTSTSTCLLFEFDFWEVEVIKPAGGVVPILRVMDIISLKSRPKPFKSRFPKLNPLRV